MHGSSSAVVTKIGIRYCRCNELRFAQIVPRSETANFGFMWPEDDANGNREDSVSLCCVGYRERVQQSESTDLGFVFDSFINHIMRKLFLLFAGSFQLFHSRLDLLKVYQAQTAVEHDFTQVQGEIEAELFVIDRVVSTQIEQCIVEVFQCFLELADQEP